MEVPGLTLTPYIIADHIKYLVGGDCFELTEQESSRFLRVFRECEEIVAHTPPQSMGSSPTVSYYGCRIGEPGSQRPTVVILSSSREYSHILNWKLRRSRTLIECGFELRCLSHDFSPGTRKYEQGLAVAPDRKPWLRELWSSPFSRQPTRVKDEEKQATKSYETKKEGTKTQQAGTKPQPSEVIFIKPETEDFNRLIERVDQDAEKKAQ